VVASNSKDHQVIVPFSHDDLIAKLLFATFLFMQRWLAILGILHVGPSINVGACMRPPGDMLLTAR
jgi:hypothetical protein